VLTEVERDESYEQLQRGKHEPMTNNKEFLSWKEFETYFFDYKEIEERNPKGSTAEQLKKRRQELFRTDNLFLSKEEEFKSLLQKETERRLKELPKLRPAD